MILLKRRKCLRIFSFFVVKMFPIRILVIVEAKFMRFKKVIVVSLIVLTTFLMYLFFHDTKIQYVVLGDSLAAGQNPFGEKTGYGYSDYIKEYLEKNGKLEQYIKEYATSGYTTEDILHDLESNKKVYVSGHEVNLRKALRESDLVTLSIGANDFMKDIRLDDLDLSHVDTYIQKIDIIMESVHPTLKEIRKYAKNKLIVIGYYNPFPLLFRTSEKEVDTLFRYIDNSFDALCSLYHAEYVSVYQLFKDHWEFLPNPFDIHPNLKGYEGIAHLVIEKYLKE